MARKLSYEEKIDILTQIAEEEEDVIVKARLNSCIEEMKLHTIEYLFSKVGEAFYEAYKPMFDALRKMADIINDFLKRKDKKDEK